MNATEEELLTELATCPKSVRRIQLLNALAKLLTPNRLTDAEIHNAESIQLSNEFISEPDRIDALINRACILYWKAHFNESLDALNSCREQAESLGDIKRLAELHWHRGRAYRALGDWEKSLACQIETQQLSERINNHELLVNSLLETGILHRLHGDFEKALSTLEHALEIQHTLSNQEGKADILLNIGVIYANQGNYAKSLETYLFVKEIYEEIANPIGMINVSMGIGALFDTMGDYTSALKYAFDALEIAQNLSLKGRVASVLNLIGNAYVKMNNDVTALKYLLQSLMIFEDIGHKSGLGQVLGHIGNIYFRMNRYERALRYYEKSLLLLRQVNEQESEVEALLAIGETLFKLSKHDEARQYLNNSLELATRINSAYFVIACHKAFIEIYKQTQQPKKASEHLRHLREAREKFFPTQDRLRMAELITQQELDKIQSELLLLDEEEKKELTASVKQTASARASSFLFQDPFHDVELSVAIETFGNFAVTIGEHEISDDKWQRKKTRDVFKILLLNYKQPVTVDTFHDLLWSKADYKTFEGSFFKTISQLRSALHPSAVKSDRLKDGFIKTQDKTYTLDFGDSAMIDFLEFKRLISIARREKESDNKFSFFTQAASLYKGEFLRENLMDDWTTFERETLKDAFLEAVAFIGLAHLRKNEFDAAIEIAEKILSVEPISEIGFEILLLAHKEKGQPADVKRIYARCKEVYHKEFKTLPPQSLQKFNPR